MSSDVLLVEDDPLYRKSIKLYFRDKPYRFIEAGSLEEGLETIDGNSELQVILMDLSFKQQPTAQNQSEEHEAVKRFLKSLRQRPDGYRVIILTAHDEIFSAEEAAEYGIFHYLPKTDPSTPEAIRFSVEQAFKDLSRVELERKTQFILDVQKRINDNQPAGATLDLICRAVCSTVDGYTCHFRVYDFNRGDYHLAGFYGPSDDLREMFARPRAKGEFFSGRVVATGRPEFYSDLQSMDAFMEHMQSVVQQRTPSQGEDVYWRTVSSAYIVPISTGLFGKAVDGVLNVSSQVKDYFTPPERRKLVDEFISQAALTITKSWLDRKREKIHRDYRQIGEMLDELTLCLDKDEPVKEIYAVVARRVSKLLHPELLSIFRYNDVRKRVENVVEFCDDERLDNPAEYYVAGESLTGWVFENRKTIHDPDPDDPQSCKPLDDPRFKYENPAGYLPHIPSGTLEHYLGVPIQIGGRTEGVLRAMNKKSKYYGANGAGRKGAQLLERGFSADCRYIMEITAEHLAGALRHAKLLQDTKRRVELVQTLGAVSRLMNQAHTVDALLELTTTKMAEFMRAEIAMCFLREGDRVVLKECAGMPLFDASYAIGESLTGRVAETGKPELVVGPQRPDGKYDAVIRNHLPEKDKRPGIVESVLAVPVVTKQTTLGVLKVVNKIGDDTQYEPSDMDLLLTFAEYVAVAIENTREYELTNAQLVIAKRNAALSTLVSAVAHEIRNTSGLIPANVAGLRAQLGATAPDQIAKRLALIERVANQATDFANELAGFAAGRRGEMQVLNVNEIIRLSTKDLQELPKYGNTERIRLDLDLSDKELRCEIFENPFVQIVRNIVINAFQALEDSSDGRILISSRAVDGFASIRFEDNGPGIPSDYRRRIFDPTFTSKPDGNGIGLWLVQTQLEQVGGSIELEDKEDGGASFVVTIPLVSNGGQPAA